PRIEGQGGEQGGTPTGRSASDPIPAELTTILPSATTRWITILRTVNLLEGFLSIPTDTDPKKFLPPLSRDEPFGQDEATPRSPREPPRCSSLTTTPYH